MFSSRRVLYGALSKVPPLVRMAVLGAPRLQPTRGPAISFQAFSTIVKTFKSQHKAPPSDTVVKNERISFPTMRVVYPGVNGGNEWKIMTRTEALQFASEREGDLIVVNATSDPPVCKIDASKEKRADHLPKEKEVRGPSKARTLKEMFMTGGIEQRDFNMKMKKVTEFLTKGHPVKVSIVPKKFLKNNRFTKDGVKRDRMQGFDGTILMLLSALEGMQVVVTEQKVKQTPPPQAAGPVKTKGAPVKAKPAPRERPARSAGGLRDVEYEDSDSDDAATVIPDDDEVDPGDDDDDDDVDDDGKSEPYFGKQAPVRKEYMIMPKGSMITSKEKDKKK